MVRLREAHIEFRAWAHMQSLGFNLQHAPLPNDLEYIDFKLAF
jgi:hypothetical protein